MANPAINSLDQQGTELLANPLAGERRPHSSNFRFARTDVWVRDIRQVIDDAIARAQPTDGKVALLGYSLGGQRVGRTLYPGRPGSADAIAKVSRAVFLSSVFGGPTEEPATNSPTFALTVNRDPGRAAFAMTSPERDAACTGHVIEGAPQKLWVQTMEHDVQPRLGRRRPRTSDRHQSFADVLGPRLERHRRGTVDHTDPCYPGPRGRRRSGRAGDRARDFQRTPAIDDEQGAAAN